MNLDPRAAAAAITKAAASAMALAAGVRAISDDDFARVVIAEQWALSPRLDPSGTSWLPFPFWITGTAMRLFGRGLDVARLVAVALGILSAVLIYRAARWLGEEPDDALAGAAIASLFPWSARLGVATVPELFTAALTTLAVASLFGSPSRRLWGGAALVLATLSRYEAWPVAIVFAVWCAADLVRAKSRETRAFNATAAVASLLGPSVWLSWNRAAHDDALHFLARVTAYRQALGEGSAGSSMGLRLLTYPMVMLREEPEVFALLATAIALTALAGRAELRARLVRYARPAIVVLAQTAALSLAMIRDGAPTHHPERAMLMALLFVAIAAGALSSRLLQRAGFFRAFTLASAVLLASLVVRSRMPREGLVNRADEVAIGTVAASLAAPGDPILVEVADYGWLAVNGAIGRPEDVEPDRSVDPRDAKAESSFDDATQLAQKVVATGARWVVARASVTVLASLGAPVAQRGAWGLWFVAGAAPP